MDLLLIVFLTALNGVFAMSEMAIAASRRARLGAMDEAGDAGARAALQLMDQPTQFLSTVQVGITSIGVLNGIVGEAAFSGALAAWLQPLGLSERLAAITATAVVVTVITFSTIIFGELVPKRIGQLYPEAVARWVARPMLWLAVAAQPLVKLLSATTAAVLGLLRINTASARSVTEEEITASLEEGVDAGVIEAQEHRMVRNVFSLDDRPLTSLMVPRAEVQWLDASATAGDCLQRLSAGGEALHSWYPVCRGSLDDVIGVIGVARLLELGPSAEGPIEAHARPASFVPETLSGMELLEQFRARAGRLVFVVDEYGVVQGLLTPRDLLEAITGELQPAAQTDAWATQRDDGSWLLDGLMPVGELRSRLELQALPDEDRGRYNTLAGLLMHVSGRLPAVADVVECAGWWFEVVDLDGRRIDKVLARAVTTVPQGDTVPVSDPSMPRTR
ncbi:MAG: HlyC/CorC family transporter [Rhodoferax sp.]|nr:HlyC/CorC family transporter [Rhodoferax sp.]